MPQNEPDPLSIFSPLYKPLGSAEPNPWIPTPQELSVGKTEKIVDTRRAAGLIRDAQTAASDEEKQQLLDEALELLDE